MHKPMDKILRLPWFATLLILSVTLLLVNCSGKETLSVDTTPPDPVLLIPHLGDTGDSIFVAGIKVNDNNNGIDTVPDNDWLRIQWRTVLDSDLDYIKIYRYGDYSPVTFIDSLSRNQVTLNQYLDNGLHHINPVGQSWYYYVRGYDLAGNYSVSDTVSYTLLEKPSLLSPADYEEVSLSQPITFQWWKPNDSLQFRLLIFDSDNNYLWHRDLYVDADIPDDIISLNYSGPNLSIYDRIIWRVDSFDDYNVEGISMSGAESNERVLVLSP